MMKRGTDPVGFVSAAVLISWRCVLYMLALGAALGGCGAEGTETDPTASTAGRFDPFPDPSAEVDAAADTVVVGTVISHASYDVAGDAAVRTVHRIRVDASERGEPRAGDEILVITIGGRTERADIHASHEAQLSDALHARLYLRRVAPDDTGLSSEDATRAGVYGTKVYSVSGGYLGLQAARSAGALSTCENLAHVAGDGFCTERTTDWKPWSSKSVIKYWINPANSVGMLPKDVVLAIQSAMNVWNEEPGSWVRFEYQGTTTDTSSSTKSMFAFRQTCTGVRGLTQTTKTFGVITHFNTCFNDTATWSFTTLWHTALHESGHALGAEHVVDPVQVMDPGGDQVVLSWGDRNFLYRFYHGPTLPMRGDFNNDGKQDIIGFINQSVWPFLAPVDVSLWDSASSTYKPRQMWHPGFAPNGETPMVGNFDGTGGDDIVTFAKQNLSTVQVCLSDGTQFPTNKCKIWHNGFGSHTEHPEVGDFNNDGKDDILVFRTENWGLVFVALSDGTKFGTSKVWHNAFAFAGESLGVGDFNRDGCDVIVTMANGSGHPTSNKVFVALSQACNATNPQNKFGTKTEWLGSFCGKNKTAFAAYGDLWCLNQDGSAYSVARVKSTKNGFNPEVQVAGSGGPVFNQNAFISKNGSTQSLLWFEHGSRAHAYSRTTGAATQILDLFAPGPCPWNEVAGVCP